MDQKSHDTYKPKLRVGDLVEILVKEEADPDFALVVSITDFVILLRVLHKGEIRTIHEDLLRRIEVDR